MKIPFLKYIQAKLKPPFLLITCGLPATLKTTAAREIVRLKGAALLRSDEIRAGIFKDEDVFDAKIAANMEKRLSVYEKMLALADAALAGGTSVILDATFITQALRQRAAAIADRHGVAFFIMETVCPQEVALERIRNRIKEIGESNALTPDVYFINKARFETIDLGDLKKQNPSLQATHFVVDTKKFPPQAWNVIGEKKIPG